MKPIGHLLLVIGAGMLLVLLSSCVGLPSSTTAQGPYYDYGNTTPVPTHLHPDEAVTLIWSAEPITPHTSSYPATITLAIVLVPEADFLRRLPDCTIVPGDMVLDLIRTSTHVGRFYQRTVVIPQHLAPGPYELIHYRDRGLDRACTSTTITVTGRKVRT